MSNFFKFVTGKAEGFSHHELEIAALYAAGGSI